MDMSNIEDSSFMTLSAGGMQAVSPTPSSNLSESSVQLEYTPASSVSALTHDTSRTKYHIDELSTFAQRLEQAAKSIFPNRGRSRYKDVQVLLLRWEEDGMGVQYELDDLATTFEEDYGFKTETWLIPTTQAHLALMGKAFKMVKDFGLKDNLIIVYYAGHGGMNSSRQPLWTCTAEPNSPYLQWYAIQTIFEQAEADVLLLLDCCAAASSAPADGQCNSVTETIAACGFETWAPQPGRHSFTNTLIAVLEDWQDRAKFTAAMLHCEILNRLRHEKPERRRNIKKFECRRTPVHIFSTIDAKAGSVEICRRTAAGQPVVSDFPTGKAPEVADSGSAMDIDSVPSGIARTNNSTSDPYGPESLTAVLDDGETSLPHVLISLSLEEEQLLDFEQCRNWLQQFPALAKFVKIEGVYKSNSTLMILSIPVLIWDWLPEDMACSFIGYVHSSNLLSQEVPSSIPITVPDKSIMSSSVPPILPPGWRAEWVDTKQTCREQWEIPERILSRGNHLHSTQGDVPGESHKTAWNIENPTSFLLHPNDPNSQETLDNRDQRGRKLIRSESADSLQAPDEISSLGGVVHLPEKNKGSNYIKFSSDFTGEVDKGDSYAAGNASESWTTARTLSSTRSRSPRGTSDLGPDLSEAIALKSTNSPLRERSNKALATSLVQTTSSREATFDMSQDSKKITGEEKRKNFLERNRVAALKCKQRKKQWLANLQQRVELFSAENDNLNQTVSQLRDELVNLKTLLSAHKDCPVSHSQGMSNGGMEKTLEDDDIIAYMTPSGVARRDMFRLTF